MKAIVLALAAAAAAPQSGAQTVQQRFDAASAKLDTDAAGALADFRALEVSLLAEPTPNQTNLAVTRARKAEALLALGKPDEALAALDQALAGHGLDKPALAPVRDNTRLIRAQVLEAQLDHVAATEEYLRLAESAGPAITRAVALMGAARTTMFVDPAAALQYADKALALAESDPSTGKKELANVLDIKGRILNNAGRYAEAKAVLVRAVTSTGGLTDKVNQNDVSLRGDAALAFLRLGEEDDARKYLAYTGAGRTDVPLGIPVGAQLPACGGIEGLRSEDSAVIEFSIMDDGRVVGAHPVYASRPGEMAYDFARAVSGWSWNPENAAKVKPFFRVATRVEVRCSNRTKRPPIAADINRALTDWAREKGVELPEIESEAEQAKQLGARLAALPAAPGTERLMLLALLARNNVVEDEKRVAYATEAEAMGVRLSVPATARLSLAVARISAEAGKKSDWSSRLRLRRDQLRALLQRPEFAADPRLRATIELLVADDSGQLKQPDDAMASLKTIVDDKALEDRDPLKIAALVQLANIYAAQKRMDEAQAAYRRTGLSAEQCALVDGGPVMLRSNASFNDFPQEALRWGFEGWTMLEYDVAANGTVRDARVVAAYPPEVFGKASERMAHDFRYSISYRPDGDLACSGMNSRVRFRIPSYH